MATYCFVCVFCSARFESLHRSPLHCGQAARRDYGAEGVGLGSGVKVSRDGTVNDSAALFLPGNKDFAGPRDPDGNKGMRKWRDAHGPRDTNTKPRWPGTVDREVF